MYNPFLHIFLIDALHIEIYLWIVVHTAATSNDEDDEVDEDNELEFLVWKMGKMRKKFCSPFWNIGFDLG